LAGLLDHKFVQGPSAFFARSHLISSHKSRSGKSQAGQGWSASRSSKLRKLCPFPRPSPSLLVSHQLVSHQLVSHQLTSLYQHFSSLEQNKELVMLFLRVVILSLEVSFEKSYDSRSFNVSQEPRQERERSFRPTDILKIG